MKKERILIEADSKKKFQIFFSKDLATKELKTKRNLLKRLELYRYNELEQFQVGTTCFSKLELISSWSYNLTNLLQQFQVAVLQLDQVGAIAITSLTYCYTNLELQLS